MGIFKRKLPRRKLSSSRAPIIVTLTVQPPLPFTAIHGINVLKNYLQEQYLSDTLHTAVPIGWDTLVLLENIATALNSAATKYIMGDDTNEG